MDRSQLEEPRALSVREWYEESKTIVVGAPDLLAPRRDAICRLGIDGRPFGEHFVDEPRYVESDLLANVLVACSIDSELSDIRSLPERSGTNTPDFEATILSDHSRARIEVTQFTDALVRAYMGDLNSVFTPLQTAWRADAKISQRIHGMHVVFYFPLEAPRGRERGRARDEILSILRRIDRVSIAFGYRFNVPENCEVLRARDVTWSVTHLGDTEAKVQFRPSLTIPDATRIVNAAERILVDKKLKYPSYSDNGTVPVWLAVFVADGISGVGLTAIQTLSENVHSLKPDPFDRLLIANHVAGLRIDRDPSVPAIYQSLTTYREVSRS